MGLLKYVAAGALEGFGEGMVESSRSAQRAEQARAALKAKLQTQQMEWQRQDQRDAMGHERAIELEGVKQENRMTLAEMRAANRGGGGGGAASEEAGLSFDDLTPAQRQSFIKQADARAQQIVEESGYEVDFQEAQRQAEAELARRMGFANAEPLVSTPMQNDRAAMEETGDMGIAAPAAPADPAPAPVAPARSGSSARAPVADVPLSPRALGRAAARGTPPELPRITTEAEFNALPVGARFIGPDGMTRVKKE